MVSERFSSERFSKDAMDLCQESDLIDLHIDSFIWNRVFGYRLDQRHAAGPLDGRFYNQADLPRLRESGFTGGAWVITTNPLRPSKNRLRTFDRNLMRLKEIFAAIPEQIQVVRSAGDYELAKKAGKHAAWIAIQGGNAWDADLDAIERYADTISRVTLVHMLHSSLGRTSTPIPFLPARGLTSLGKEFVERMNRSRIFVDLAHIDRRSFFDVVEIHDPSLPILVTHTGVNGVHRHWRNLDDDQIRAIAKSGGVVGIVYHAGYLGPDANQVNVETVMRHLEHVIQVVGEDFAALGSDWDGAIICPRDLRTCAEFPKLVQTMLDRGWKEQTIQKVMGLNYLRALRMMRA